MTYPPDDLAHAKVATQQDIARRVGVSKVTVSRVMRGDYHNASRSTVNCILAVAREIGYDPSQHHDARRLALSKYGQGVPSNVIALFVPRERSDGQYFPTISHHLLDALTAPRFSLVTHFIFESDDETLPPIFHRGDVDGAIILGPSPHSKYLVERLRARTSFSGRPIVTLFEALDGCQNIISDNFAGGYSAAAHLLDLGHRHLLICRESIDSDPYRQRENGIRQAFADRYLDPQASLHAIKWDARSPERSADLLFAAIAAHPKSTAILASNDTIAHVIWDMLKSRGYSLPGDFSLIGYYDTDAILDERGANLLSTVKVSLEKAGQLAAAMILQQLTGNLPPAEQVVLPTELIVRHSTTVPRRNEALLLSSK